MLYSIWKKCCLCGCICDEWEYNPKIDNFICINCSETVDEDYIRDLCERANYYGMESLTEKEQYILNHMEDLLIK